MKITPTCEMNANEAFHGHKRDNSQFMHKREFSKSSDFLTASCGPNCKSQAVFSNVSGVAWTAGTEIQAYITIVILQTLCARQVF